MKKYKLATIVAYYVFVVVMLSTGVVMLTDNMTMYVFSGLLLMNVTFIGTWLIAMRLKR